MGGRGKCQVKKTKLRKFKKFGDEIQWKVRVAKFSIVRYFGN